MIKIWRPPSVINRHIKEVCFVNAGLEAHANKRSHVHVELAGVEGREERQNAPHVLVAVGRRVVEQAFLEQSR